MKTHSYEHDETNTIDSRAIRLVAAMMGGLWGLLTMGLLVMTDVASARGHNVPRPSSRYDWGGTLRGIGATGEYFGWDVYGAVVLTGAVVGATVFMVFATNEKRLLGTIYGALIGGFVGAIIGYPLNLLGLFAGPLLGGVSWRLPKRNPSGQK